MLVYKKGNSSKISVHATQQNLTERVDSRNTRHTYKMR